MVNKKLSKVFAKVSTASVLAVMIAISCFSAVAVNSGVMSSGDTVKSKSFGAGTDIYLKINGQSWEGDSAKIGAFFYYTDHIEWCYEKNNEDYSAGNIGGKKDQAISGYETAERVESGVYRVSVPDINNLGAVTFLRISSDGNTLWGYSAQMYADDMGSNNCVQLNAYEGSSSWTKYESSTPTPTPTPTPGGKGYNYYVPADSTILNNSNLFTVNATYYDYWSDNERSQNNYLENEGDRDDIGKWWYQFDDFNSYISSYANSHTSWRFPLYFGNMFKGDEHYDMFKQHASALRNMTGVDGPWINNEYYAINNSNGMYWYNSNSQSSYNQSLQGLAGTHLDGNGNILAAGNSTVMPYFSDSLADATYNGKKVATVIKSVFPFEKKTNSDQTTEYTFTSKNAKDNIYFSWNNRVPKTIKYGAGSSYGVYDALSKFGGDSNGYGLFPFNNNGSHTEGRPDNNELDYGFGVKLDIDFRVPEKGVLSNGQPVKFNFTGDDDLWVYIGDKSNGANSELVLDLAGDHKEAQGEIDFNTMKATAKSVFADYSNGTANIKNGAVSKTFNGGQHLLAGKTYHMTVFYMERGESESNFSVGFTMTPVNNTLTVDKTVDTTDVSETLKNPNGTKLSDICKTIDEFGYSISSTVNNAESKDYTFNDHSGASLNAKTNSDGKFPLGNGDSAFFNGTFSASSAERSNQITVTEGEPVENTYTAGKNIVYLDTKSQSWFTNDKAVPYIKLSGEASFHPMSKLNSSSTIYYYALGNNTGNFNIGRYVSGSVYNSHSFSWPLSGSNDQINVPSSDWGSTSVTYSKYRGVAPNSGTIGTTEEQKLKYGTTWDLYDVNASDAKIKSGTGLGSNFEFINSLGDEDKYNNKTDLLLSYINKVNTAPITVSKKLYEADGATEVSSEDLKKVKFAFDLYLDTNFDGVYSASEKFGSFTGLSVNTPVEISGIPVGMSYKLVESSLSGYKQVQGEVTGTVAETDNNVNFKNKVNPGSVNLSVSKSVDGQIYSGSDFKFIQKAIVKDSSRKYEESGTPQEKTTVTAGTVTFDGLTLNAPGTYYYAITEAYNDSHSNDYQVNSTIIMARVVYDLSSADITPEYAVFDDATVKSGSYLTGGTYDYDKLIDDFDEHKNDPIIANTTSRLMLNVTKSEGLKDDDSDGVAEPVTPIEGAEFELYKVDSYDVTDFTGITPVGYGVSDADGVVKFYKDSEKSTELTDLPIFKEGMNPTAKQYQIYAVRETKAAEGYVLTDEVKYVTLSTDASTGVIVPEYKAEFNRYEAGFGFVNNLITVPLAGITVDKTYFLIGCIVIGLGMLTGTYFFIKNRRRKVSYASRHSG